MFQCASLGLASCLFVVLLSNAFICFCRSDRLKCCATGSGSLRVLLRGSIWFSVMSQRSYSMYMGTYEDFSLYFVSLMSLPWMQVTWLARRRRTRRTRIQMTRQSTAISRRRRRTRKGTSQQRSLRYAQRFS